MADVKKLNNMFLVNAPAGSGKTTYIENTIINLLAQYPNRRILIKMMTCVLIIVVLQILLEFSTTCIMMRNFFSNQINLVEKSILLL